MSESWNLRSLAGVTGLALLLLFAPGLARAGCGCDHPPPDWSQVMPSFGSPNQTIAIYAAGPDFVVGQAYLVDFGGPVVPAVATFTDRIEVAVPAGVALGPVALHVTGAGYDHTYDGALFTALPNPRRIKSNSGKFVAKDYEAAVGSDGTIYVSLDVTSVVDPMQFMTAFLDLPLDYSQEDVAIYNTDGVDLTLFTEGVIGTERQWGSYFGWNVEGDKDLFGDVFKGKTKLPGNPATWSDVFTYWRHEFETYKEAHLAGGSHFVDANGLHPDGTRHIDHYNLVIAINGLERNPAAPGDPSQALPLAPGSRVVRLGWVSIQTDNPLELDGIVGQMDDTADDTLAVPLAETVLGN